MWWWGRLCRWTGDRKGPPRIPHPHSPLPYVDGLARALRVRYGGAALYSRGERGWAVRGGPLRSPVPQPVGARPVSLPRKFWYASILEARTNGYFRFRYGREELSCESHSRQTN